MGSIESSTLDWLLKALALLFLISLIGLVIAEILNRLKLIKVLLVDAEVEITKILVLSIVSRLDSLDLKANIAINNARQAVEISKLLAEHLAPDVLRKIKEMDRYEELEDPMDKYKTKKEE